MTAAILTITTFINSDMKNKSVYKYEIAQVLGVSSATFRKYLASPKLLDQLNTVNYQKNQKLIFPNQLLIICGFFGIEITEFI